jgi:uncharacterized protein DUF6983
MVQVTLQAIPAQQLQITLGGQNCQIAVYQRSTGVFVDLSVNGADISTAVFARNMAPLVPTVYLGFQGNLVFLDTLGQTDPTYTGLGSRYQLLYLTADDFASLI